MRALTITCISIFVITIFLIVISYFNFSNTYLVSIRDSYDRYAWISLILNTILMIYGIYSFSKSKNYIVMMLSAINLILCLESYDFIKTY